MGELTVVFLLEDLKKVVFGYRELALCLAVEVVEGAVGVFLYGWGCSGRRRRIRSSSGWCHSQGLRRLKGGFASAVQDVLMPLAARQAWMADR